MKSGEYGLSQPQWAELERLVREGGSRLLEPVVLVFSDDGSECELAPGRDAGRDETIRALARRGLVDAAPDLDDQRWAPISLHPERMTITETGRAVLAAHQARRGHPTPTGWRRRTKPPTVRNLVRGMIAAMGR